MQRKRSAGTASAESTGSGNSKYNSNLNLREKDGGGLTNVLDIEFFAEDELISILPRFERGKIRLMGGHVGSFAPFRATKVPLWMAIELKKARRCNIECPDWMRVEDLEALKKRESSEADSFQVVPAHFIEIVSLLLQHAPDDVPYAEQVRSLIEDITIIRENKLREGVKVIARERNNYKTNGSGDSGQAMSLREIPLNVMEVHAIKPIMCKAMERIHHFGNTKQQLEKEQEQQEQQEQQRDPLAHGYGYAYAHHNNGDVYSSALHGSTYGGDDDNDDDDDGDDDDDDDGGGGGGGDAGRGNLNLRGIGAGADKLTKLRKYR